MYDMIKQQILFFAANYKDLDQMWGRPICSPTALEILLKPYFEEEKFRYFSESSKQFWISEKHFEEKEVEQHFKCWSTEKHVLQLAPWDH